MACIVSICFCFDSVDEDSIKKLKGFGYLVASNIIYW